MSAFSGGGFDLKNAVQFVASHSYVYEARNVDAFTSNMLDRIPDVWKEVLSDVTCDELREIPFGFCKEDWPSSLSSFLSHAHELGEHRFQYHFEEHPLMKYIKVPDFIKCKTPAKKLQQIINMAALIHQFSEKHNCGIIIDIGSGLGYLDQILHYNFGLTTIGFECELSKWQSATQRVQSGSCQTNMHHIHQKITNTNECRELIRDAIEKVCLNETLCNCGEFRSFSGNDKFAKNVMMVGLHSCGDLMQDMMKLFCELPEFKVFLCAGCCYHKIAFTDFPMSDAGEEAVMAAQTEHSDWSISATGLRLACQFTRYHWAKHSAEDFAYAEKCLSYRAVLQSFLVTENLVWRRPKRHLMRENINSFEDFVMKVLDVCTLDDSVKEEYVRKLMILYEANQHLFRYQKVIMLLQQLLQPILEMLVLQDRIQYFSEHGIKNDVFVLCEEAISPRNLILYGVKS